MHKGPGMSCGGRIQFSPPPPPPPPPRRLAQDRVTAGVRTNRDDQDGLGEAGVLRQSSNGDRLSDGEYMFGRPWGR